MNKGLCNRERRCGAKNNGGGLCREGKFVNIISVQFFGEGDGYGLGC